MKTVVLAAILLFGSKTAALAQPFEIMGAECLKNGTLVGWTSDLGIAVLRDGLWQPWPIAKGVLRLWRSADGQIFAAASGDDSWEAVQIPEHSGAATTWTIPTDFGAMRFASLNGVVGVVTHDRVYRLNPGGSIVDVAQTPVGGSGQPLRDRAPEILVSQGKTVVCTGTSEREEDNVGGSCRESRGTYVYRVDFGDPLCCESEAPHFMAPLVCGEAMISAVLDWATSPPRSGTQARAFTTGALLGRTADAGRLGSTCLDGRRALLVGTRDLRVVTVPSLRTVWRKKLSFQVGAVAVCGGDKAVVVPKIRPNSVLTVDVGALSMNSPPQ